ncbi:fimbria/pilus outer membrane usher protein [Dyella flava]|uniref:Fimbrial biogenesis outer membrane usher protein n=1 Tax=Dyella flava TaxID=1920170 RepID=A0ABS2K785_9GAMM|nr:fimbria/pilus outer membrane usher protein [Dyella flava]MBM7126642.1 fimbrial biogenesis outer membrane usher protein [Dyella flava]GLQ49538.1 usher CupB3 [Dyella flava]
MTSLRTHTRLRRNGFAPAQRLLSTLILGALTPGASMAAAMAASPAEATFETDFLSAGKHVDMSRFAKGNVVLPDTYRVDIIVNQNWLGREDVTFKDMPGSASAVPCFDRATLAKWGINLDKVARGDGTRSDEEVQRYTFASDTLCGDLDTFIPGATLHFDASASALNITVPQLFMDNSARGYVDPSQWDKGIDAGLLAYNFVSSHTAGPRSSTQSYLGLNAGVNLGEWHLRHQGSLQWNSRSSSKNYQNTATYVQRDIPALKAQLMVGDTFTSGQIADSIRVRGVSLYSDPRMYPQSQQGYAPVVRGVAEGNARVAIRQNGYVIYETTVAPGPFEINDLFPTGYGGDLEVTVTETDGRKNTFLVPYTAVPQLLRPGQTQFSATAGQLRQYGTQGSTPWVAQGTWQHGFNNTFTGFGAVTASQGYTQLNAGTAINTRYGTLALNLSASNTQLPNAKSLQGQSLGLTFSKNFNNAGTNLSLGAYRYSTSGYLGLLDAVNMRDIARHGGDLSQYAHQRSRLDLNISQKIGQGQLFFSGSSTDYWGGSGRQISYSAGYSSSFKSVSWSVSAQRTRTQGTSYNAPLQTQADLADDIFYGPGRVTPSTTDNRIMFTLSMPLGTAPKAPTLNTYLTNTTGSSPSKSVQVGVSGTAGKNNNITYNASANRNIDQSSSQYFNANLGYQASYANLRGGYSRSGNANQISASADGGVIIHAGGVQFAQQLGDTIGLVEAPGAAGASISNAVGVRVGNNGYAVVPYLMPYQLNTVNLDPKGASDDLELKNTSATVAPRLGAVVKLKYQTESGRAVIIKATQPNGEPLPFAADVLDDQGKSVGSVGQASKLFVRGIADRGSLLVKWGDSADSECRIAYQLPSLEKGKQQNAAVVQGQCAQGNASAMALPAHASASHGGQSGLTVRDDNNLTW